MGSRKTETRSSQRGRTTPVEPSEFANLGELLRSFSEERLAAESALPAGFEERGLAGINRTFGLGEDRLTNLLVSRGLSGSPVEGSGLAQLELGRLGNIAGFQSNLPILERELRDQDFRNALALFGTRPLGQEFTQSGEQTTKQSASPLDIISSIAGIASSFVAPGAGSLFSLLSGGGGGAGTSAFQLAPPPAIVTPPGVDLQPGFNFGRPPTGFFGG